MFTQKLAIVFSIAFAFAFIAAAPLVLNGTSDTGSLTLSAIASAFGGDDGGGSGGAGGPGGGDGGGGEGNGNNGGGFGGDDGGGTGGCCGGNDTGGGEGTGGFGGDDGGGTGGCCGGPGDGPDAPENDGPGDEPNEPQPPAPVCTFIVSPNTIDKGGTAKLSWTTDHATSVSINQGIGNVALDGNKNVSPQQTTTYTLTARNADGDTVVCKTTITVKTPPQNTVPKCVSFSANPTSLPKGGGTVTLSWNVTGATKVTINNGVGQFTNSVHSTTVNVTNDTTFTLTAVDADNDQATCTVSVDVETGGGGGVTPRCDFLTASPTNVEPNESIKLTWETTSATNVSINHGVGSDLDLDGEITVTAPNNEGSITYILTATRGSKTDTCSVTVDVEEDHGGGGGGGSSSPRCTLEISDRTIKRGESVRLSWDTDHANEVSLYEGTERNGDRIFHSRDDDEVEDGHVTVRPDRDTTYTLVAERGSRDRTCTAKVRVEDEDVVVLSDRFQEPRVAGITLTQVPYTGFDAGPTLTFIFYALLALWGAMVAYFYIYKRQPKVAASAPTYGEATREEFEKKVERLTNLYTGRNW